jgi:uncharacterized membrane protein
MNQHIIARIAIYLLSVIMIIFGVYHFQQPRTFVTWVPTFLPGGMVWVYITGAAFILAALAFITNKFVKLAGYLLAAMLIIFVLSVHLPAYQKAGVLEERQIAFINMLKDLALAAFALHIAGSADKKGVKY